MTTAKPTLTAPSIVGVMNLPTTQTTTGNYSIQGATSPFWNNTLNVNEGSGIIDIKGTAKVDGDIVIKGQSLSETLEKINERLNILVPNTELEKDWEKLANLRQQYVELERELLEKQRVFDILKKQ